MITAKQARDLADNITSSAAQELLSSLDVKIKEAASKGLFELDISVGPEIPCVLSYLEHLGYTIEELHDQNYLLKRTIHWR